MEMKKFSGVLPLKKNQPLLIRTLYQSEVAVNFGRARVVANLAQMAQDSERRLLGKSLPGKCVTRGCILLGCEIHKVCALFLLARSFLGCGVAFEY